MSARRKLSLWGGIECSIVRVGDHYRDQIRETGHHARPGDLDAVAALGIRTLRYPVLWESVAPNSLEECDWRWHDERLARLRELGITPIVGLVHHGSGPRYAPLPEPAFAEGLACFAEKVAARYPWIEHFTPVNEPLTTARFCGLYGHWYPHGTDYRQFLRALVVECRAVVLAMRAIRRVNRRARLIQTEDLGKTFSTPRIAHQAAHDNERRWLSLDLLCGRVDANHPWRAVFLDNGVSAAELDFFLDGDGKPDFIGINHYVTSDRFLDHRLELYPPHLHGGNGRDAYVDVEAVRVPLTGRELGTAARLREAWDRYLRPLAITEAHLGCTEDEQVRWLWEVWSAAEKVWREGIDMRAVTVWSLFGAVDWDSLLTAERGSYEPGVFDARSDPPSPTELARSVEELARHGSCGHHFLADLGWWRRDDRFTAALEPLPDLAPCDDPEDPDREADARAEIET